MKTTTIFELSKLLKLSPSTVSRALKNHPDIAPDTKKRILDLATQLDYEPNLFAAGLRKNNSREVAIVVPSINGFFYDSFIAAIEEEARAGGYSLIVLLSADDPEAEMENLKICRQRRVDGVFVCVTPFTNSADSFNKFKKFDTPVIFFDKVPDWKNIDTICLADEQAAKLAAQELISKGKTNIVSLFGTQNLSITRRRETAFNEVLKNSKQAIKHTTHHAASAAEAEAFTLQAFKSNDKPDAVFCMSDEILIGVMKAVQILGIKIPEGAGLITISNGFFPSLYHPEITYVETSGYKLGKQAFKRFLGYINGEKEPVTLNVESHLHIRGSL